jgi:protein-tyrosine-phosphatase
MAHAYLNHLIEENVALGNKFCRVISAGITARKPGVPLSPGVDFMLRDFGICENFQHTSRRLEARDILNYEFILCLQTAHRDEVLAQFPTRAEISGNGQSPASNITTREDIQNKVYLLGGFGEEQDREVSVPENIGGEYWFQVGRRRIYPGYERCFNDIRRYIHEFVFAITGIDINEMDIDITDTDDSREVSPEHSDNEEFGEGFFDAPNKQWDGPSEESPFDELEKVISTCRLIHFSISFYPPYDRK